MKDLIITETINLFNTYGYRFSMENLAKNLKISKKTLYKYFSSKEALITYVIDESFNEVHVKQHQIYNSNLDIETKLIKILTTKFNREDQIKMENAKDIKKFYPNLATKIETRYKEEWNLVEELLTQGENEGIFSFWSLTYTIELMQTAMSIVYKHLNGDISYSDAIKISMNNIVKGIKKGN